MPKSLEATIASASISFFSFEAEEQSSSGRRRESAVESKARLAEIACQAGSFQYLPVKAVSLSQQTRNFRKHHGFQRRARTRAQHQVNIARSPARLVDNSTEVLDVCEAIAR